jgi:hypothetical protein
MMMILAETHNLMVLSNAARTGTITPSNHLKFKWLFETGQPFRIVRLSRTVICVYLPLITDVPKASAGFNPAQLGSTPTF